MKQKQNNVLAQLVIFASENKSEVFVINWLKSIEVLPFREDNEKTSVEVYNSHISRESVLKGSYIKYYKTLLKQFND